MLVAGLPLLLAGNFCPLCDKCYDDDDYESKMMQCGRCDRWVHSKCEHLSGEAPPSACPCTPEGIALAATPKAGLLPGARNPFTKPAWVVKEAQHSLYPLCLRNAWAAPGARCPELVVLN